MDQDVCFHCHKKSEFRNIDWRSDERGRYGHICCFLLAQTIEIRQMGSEIQETMQRNINRRAAIHAALERIINRKTPPAA